MFRTTSEAANDVKGHQNPHPSPSTSASTGIPFIVLSFSSHVPLIFLSLSFHFPSLILSVSFQFLSFVFSHFFRIDSPYKKHHEPERSYDHENMVDNLNTKSH